MHTIDNLAPKTKEQKEDITILFAGDSGDGIQLTGSQFTDTAALLGNDISTFPDFPAEIRAPQGTLAGVSGFQLHFGSIEIYTPGDTCDVFVAMNAAALKANLKKLKAGGIIIANTSGFDKKNLSLAKYPEGINPLEEGSLGKFRVYSIDITKLTRLALTGSGLSTKETERSKNMYVLGFLYWLYHRPLERSEELIREKFKGKPELIDANIKVLKAGYNYGDTTETFTTRYEVKAAPLPKGIYRNIMGNQATAYGLIAASQQSGLDLFFGSYPITPASDILHELSRHKNFGIKTFQAEDEIAAITSAIGASFGGALGVTASSGPGMALKSEAIGLAVMYEIPLVICDVQRGGPSTGLPTKTEQADLFQAMYGRNSEAPVAVIAASSPFDCFNTVFEACRIAVEHMTPVIFLSDGYIANGAEPWKFPKAAELPLIKPNYAKDKNTTEPFLAYKRDERLVRPWAIPGRKGFEHRIGGIEKENETGNISYDPENHQLMVKLRAGKVSKIADHIPLQHLNAGALRGKVLVLGWGSTYGAITIAVKDLVEEGLAVSHAHLRYLNPFPKNLGEILKNFDSVLIPEMNNGQLVSIIRDKFLVNAEGFNKIKGAPFSAEEIKDRIRQLIAAA